MSDKKKNNYGNRLISLHHRSGQYIVNDCVGKCEILHKNGAKLLWIYLTPLKRRERTSKTMYDLRECVTKQKINSNSYYSLLQKGWWIGTTTCSNASTVDYVILSLECFPVIKGFEIQNFESVLSQKQKLACFMLVVRDEIEKFEVIF